MMGKAFGGRTKTAQDHRRRRLGAADRRGERQAGRPGGADRRRRSTLAENTGIVFIDEIDKVASRSERAGADVSREGVQRDLLPLIEGTTVSTKHGPVKTDHILFIASGAFHVAKPSDLLPELQGRLPIRVELKALTRDDLRRILTEPEANLIRQHQALLATEGVDPDLHRRRHRRPGRRRRGGERRGGEHRRAAPADGAGKGGRGDQLHRRRPRRRDHRRSTAPMCASASASWRRTPTCRGSSSSVLAGGDVAVRAAVADGLVAVDHRPDEVRRLVDGVAEAVPVGRTAPKGTGCSGLRRWRCRRGP